MDASERGSAMIYRKTEISRNPFLKAQQGKPAAETIANSTGEVAL
jgi:hypothetical protein